MDMWWRNETLSVRTEAFIRLKNRVMLLGGMDVGRVKWKREWTIYYN